MNRCTHCNRILWLYQDKSPGKSMHWDCWRVTQLIIQRENQAQYEVERKDTGWSSEEHLRQAQMRWREEDRM